MRAAALGGTLSSYTWICMIINFLQTRNPKILPNLQQPPFYDASRSQGGTVTFCDDLESLKGFGKDNGESLGDLLFGFFRRYGHEINYEREVISVREGGLISKLNKKWHLLQNNRLGVEEPFNIERNLGNTADDTSFRGVHLELRRAFDLISQGKLNECCEQYEFPVHEERFWTRPPQQPRPIIARSQSQSGRPVKGGSNSSKGSGSGQRHRNGPSNRRASSAAAMNKMPLYTHMPNGERSVSSNQIHDQLIHHYQLLQHQEQQLRLQMHQRAQATLHAQITAQVQHQPLQANTAPYVQQANSDGHRRHSNIDPPPLSAPLRSVQAYYYPVPVMNQSPSLPTSQSTTSPSSPSQAAAQLVPIDVRRGARPIIPADNAGLRSHSQPPANIKVNQPNGRTVPTNARQPPPQGQLQGYSTLQQYQQAYLQSRRGDRHQSTPDSPDAGSLFYDPTMDDVSFRQYMGYFVDPNGAHHPRDRHFVTPQYSGYSDLAQRARTVSPNLSRLGRQSSRSPSPSRSSLSGGHSINFYSSESPPFQQYSRGMVGDGPTRSSGPVIVDGSSDASDYATPPETVFYPPVSSGPASTNSDDRPIDTPTSGSAPTPVQERTDPLALDGHSERPNVPLAPGTLQFGEFPARASFRPAQTARSDDGRTPEMVTQVPTIREEMVAGVSPNALGIEVDPSKALERSLLKHNMPQKSAHHSSTLSGLNLASSLKPLATLSPVREVRTPSPTTTRGQSGLGEAQSRSAHGRASSLTGSKEPAPSPLAESYNAHQDLAAAKASLPKGKASNSAELKGNEIQPPPNGLPITTSATKAPAQRELQQLQPKPNHAPQTSGWQQSTNKKKKNKKSASVGSATIPMDPSERKGG